jgi:LPXTG-motif cell wall-anchored protein
MLHYRRFGRGGNGLDDVLRSLRVEPRDEFVSQLSQRVKPSHTPLRRPWSRLAFAAAAATLILGTFASFGGVGYTASGAAVTYHSVKQVLVKHKFRATVHESSAASQYGGTPNVPNTPTGGVAAGNSSQALGVAAAAQSQNLPFTGISLVTTVLVGLALIAVGLFLRRRERRET